jgi:hypothetical protein
LLLVAERGFERNRLLDELERLCPDTEAAGLVAEPRSSKWAFIAPIV